MFEYSDIRESLLLEAAMHEETGTDFDQWVCGYYEFFVDKAHLPIDCVTKAPFTDIFCMCRRIFCVCDGYRDEVAISLAAAYSGFYTGFDRKIILEGLDLLEQIIQSRKSSCLIGCSCLACCRYDSYIPMIRVKVVQKAVSGLKDSGLKRALPAPPTTSDSDRIP